MSLKTLKSILSAALVAALAAACAGPKDVEVGPYTVSGIEKLYPGHYHGDNSSNGLNRVVTDFGVNIRYNDPDALR